MSQGHFRGGGGGSITLNVTTLSTNLLAGKAYDPGTAVTNKATSSLLAMTALDTTNLRLSFTVPANGCVRVRVRVTTHGSGTSGPILFLGILQGSTVIARMAPLSLRQTGSTSRFGQEVDFVVPGLTPGANLTWDLAYGVETLAASTNIKYGGPDNATTNDAWGSVIFEVYDTQTLLGAKLYDPGSAVQKSTASLLAMTALDTTNLRLTFTAPASGNVRVIIRTMTEGSATQPSILLGVLDGATVRARTSPFGGNENFQGTVQATDHFVWRGDALVTGLTPGNSYTWDAAYGVEVVSASTFLGYGGPDDTTGDNAYGAIGYEIWSV